MNIQLSDHFNYKRLIRFALPSVVMMVFTSIYSVVDGFFVSNYVGETEFAAVNFIMPIIMLQDAVGFMLSNGGAALVAMQIGQKNEKRANENFSMIIYAAIIIGTVLGLITWIFVKRVAIALGASGAMLDASVLYARVILITSPAFMLQYTFQSFFVAAERPNLGLTFTAIAGVSNMILDWLFMAVFGWGVVGAAVASCIGQTIGGFGPMIYFARPNKSLLRLCKTKFRPKEFLKACTNGAAEFMTNASSSLVNTVYNVQLMKMAGEYGVSAYGVIMYVTFIFLAMFFGYTMGVAPIVSYNHGAEAYDELHNVTKKSLKIIIILSLAMLCTSELLAKPLATLFAGYDETFLAISIHAFRLYALCYILTGTNIFGSGFFAALNDGKIASIISSLRTLVFQLLCVLVVPLILGTDGIWLSMFFAEIGTAFFTITFLIKFKDKYHY